MELVLIVSVLVATAELLTIKRLNNENKKQKGVIRERTEALRNAKIEVKKLRKQRTQSVIFTNKTIKIVNGSGTLVDKYDKIKELVDKLENGN